MSLHRVTIGLLLGGLLAVPTLAQNSASAPDFTGRWGRNAFNFEPLPNGPKPLTNLARMPNGTSNNSRLMGDYKNPILKPETAEVVRKQGEISLSGQAFPDPSNQCRPYNPPFTHAMQLGVEMIQTRDSITLLYDQDDQVRRIRLNASHPANLKPSPMGDSVGHYEGDTLVVDTIGIKPGPYALVDRFGTPVSAGLHVVERYRLIEGATAKEAQDRHEQAEGRVGGGPPVRAIDPDLARKGLQILVTIEDPNVFTVPWSATLTYRAMSSSVTWLEQVCAENPVDHYPGEWAGLPRADKPDF